MSMTEERLRQVKSLTNRALSRVESPSIQSEPQRKMQQTQWEQFQQIVTEAKADLQTARDKLTSAYHRLDSVTSFVSPETFDGGQDGHQVIQAIQELGQAVTGLVDYTTSRESSGSRS